MQLTPLLACFHKSATHSCFCPFFLFTSISYLRFVLSYVSSCIYIITRPKTHANNTAGLPYVSSCTPTASLPQRLLLYTRPFFSSFMKHTTKPNASPLSCCVPITPYSSPSACIYSKALTHAMRQSVAIPQPIFTSNNTPAQTSPSFLVRTSCTSFTSPLNVLLPSHKHEYSAICKLYSTASTKLR